jgi:hypothetical protein
VRAALVGFALGTTVASSAVGADRHPAPTIPWTLAQVVPSPQVAFGNGAAFGLRWQLTPFLYSWGIHRSAPRKWRSFIVEPPMRHSGSFELFGGPEWLNGVGWFGRAGARSYFPVVDRGEALAISIGTSAWTNGHSGGPSLEIGAHVLFGVFAVLLTQSPRFREGEWIATLQVRVL